MMTAFSCRRFLVSEVFRSVSLWSLAGILGVVSGLSIDARAADEKASSAKPEAARQGQIFGIRIVKEKVGLTRQQPVVTFPGHQDQCRLTGYQGENQQEFYFDVELLDLAPKACTVQVACPALTAGAVWVGRTKVPFVAGKESVTFSLVADASNAYALHISLRDEPEVLLYYMPKPRLRASGPYRDVPWPEVAAAAEVNLLFALRTVFTDMKLAASKKADGDFDGYVAIGGFETNYPRVGRGPGGHEDFPPHVHLFLVVPPGWRIRQASHIYIDSQGRLTGRVQCQGSDPSCKYGPGQWCPQRDFAGRLAFEFQVDQQGCLVVRRSAGKCEYRLRVDPASGSFRAGCTVEKAGKPWCRTQTTDDTAAGLLRIAREFPGDGGASRREEETIRYDPETAAIVSRSKS